MISFLFLEIYSSSATENSTTKSETETSSTSSQTQTQSSTAAEETEDKKDSGIFSKIKSMFN